MPHVSIYMAVSNPLLVSPPPAGCHYAAWAWLPQWTLCLYKNVPIKRDNLLSQRCNHNLFITRAGQQCCDNWGDLWILQLCIMLWASIGDCPVTFKIEDTVLTSWPCKAMARSTKAANQMWLRCGPARAMLRICRNNFVATGRGSNKTSTPDDFNWVHRERWICVGVCIYTYAYIYLYIYIYMMFFFFVQRQRLSLCALYPSLMTYAEWLMRSRASSATWLKSELATAEEIHHGDYYKAHDMLERPPHTSRHSWSQDQRDSALCRKSVQ
jgi:hypothetical protein